MKKTMQYSSLSNSELFQKTKIAAQNEKTATLILIEYLAEVERRKLYAEKAYSSLFDFVMSELGYSESQTADRVNAVRLMESVPGVKKHLEEGSLTLTTVSQIQRFVRAECKAAQEKGGKYANAVSKEVKESLVQDCLNLSKREVEKKLYAQMSEAARVVLQEKVRVISEDRSELRFSVGAETVLKLDHLKELIGNASLQDIFERALDALIFKEEKKRGMDKKGAGGDGNEDLARESPQPPDPRVMSENMWIKDSTLPAKLARDVDPYSRYIPIDWKRQIFQRSKGQCEFLEKTGGRERRCSSRFRLQIDHIQPLALGGKTELENLRHLCTQHNQRQARVWGLSATKRS